VAKVIQELAEKKRVIVIEHDLAVLDFLTDQVHLVYGEEGSYGVMTAARNVRHGINTYLGGFLHEENIRVREDAIRFETRPPRAQADLIDLLDFPPLSKDLGTFKLKSEAGRIHHGEVVGVVGPNGTGKTTFVKMLAKVIPPDGEVALPDIKVSYKPQYVKAEFDGTVKELLAAQAPELLQSGFYQAEIARPMTLKALFEKQVSDLSGGELQRVAVSLALYRDADIYLLDEPSAYLDVNQRINAAKTIRRVMEKKAKSALIVDHDVYFLDLVADSMMVFGGNPGVEGKASGPFLLREGMNRFLKDVGVTFRRDNETKRPRINKTDSRLDREQRQAGEYYYAPGDANSE
jgi:ATP-binding cassette subfamily E protein 1